MFTVLISGSRNDPDLLTQDRVRYALGLIAHLICPEGGLLRHGDANGIDTFGASFWHSKGHEFTDKAYPYPRHRGKLGGPLRNQQMVNDGADIGLFFPAPDSVGTYDCLRKAKAAGIVSFELTNTWNKLNLFHDYVYSLADQMRTEPQGR
jgi:hypothetical protein